MDDLDLDDPAAIGGETRRRLSAALDQVEGIRDLARLLSEFEATEQVARLPGLVARLARGGAVVIEKVLAALVTETRGRRTSRCEGSTDSPQCVRGEQTRS